MAPILHLCFLVASFSFRYVRSFAVDGVATTFNHTSEEQPARLEFSAISQSGPAFHLFILALQQFQQANQSHELSYYQIAGIHGRPFLPWDGVQGSNPLGYCTHASILFPLWHRLYVILFEQIIWRNAQQIAASYPLPFRKRYQIAARTLRIPYWDWALNTTMPTLVNEPMIDVNTPRGSANIRNPLYAYVYHPQPSTSNFPLNNGTIAHYHATVRHPDEHGNSQPSLANQELNANRQALHDLTYQLLSDQWSYAPFSNTGYADGRGGRYNSIENMHNAIHYFVGGTGNMAVFPYSAFDPVFWLHHANVDRLFSLWQALYPDAHLTTSQANAQGTFTLPPGGMEDASSSLTPFRTVDNKIHNANTAWNIRSFGYTYPELLSPGSSNDTASSDLSPRVRSALNRLYNPTGSIVPRSLSSKTSTPSVGSRATPQHQYNINIRACPSSLNSSFTIHFFLGAPPDTESSSAWSTAPNLIASHVVMYMPSPSSPTQTSEKALAYGTVPLTSALLGEGLNAVLPSSEVERFLKEKLEWRAQRRDGTIVDTEDERLRGHSRIFVVGREVTWPAESAKDGFPEYGQFTTLLTGATDGRFGGPGGLRPDEPM